MVYLSIIHHQLNLPVSTFQGVVSICLIYCQLGRSHVVFSNFVKQSTTERE